MRSWNFSQRLPLAIAALLLALLAVLATLQYRWSGEVSVLERQRMRSSLMTAGSRFSDDFNREIARAFLYFHPEPMETEGDRTERFVRQLDRWNAEAPYPRLVRDVFLVQPGGLQVLRPAEQRFVACPWPAELAGVRRRLTEVPRPEGRRGGRFGRGTVVDGSVPALVIPLSFPAPPEDHRHDEPLDHLVVRFDRPTIAGEIFPALTRRYFEGPREGDYALAVLEEGSPGRAVFVSDPGLPAASFRNGDLTLTTLEVRPFEELRSLWMTRRVGGEDDRRPTGPFWPRMEGGPEGPRRENGVWKLVLKRRDGSLEEAVAAIRRRNLGISLGILALLGATAGLLMVSTQRAQRLARQQIEFVAGVTHELHTPLTAILSAGQNLADGVVAEPAQVRRYGVLIASEGRRLTSMVGQVLELAGIQSGRRVYHPRPVEVAEILDGALQDCRWLLQEKRIEVERDVEAGLPPVLADAVAVRHAVQNLLENAVKYGGRARWIGVKARLAASGQVAITVSDRGPGVRAEDRPHLFKPFFRGRDAAAGSIPGSGLGLSLVRHIAEAHGGRVAVAAEVGEGSAFTLHLPAVVTSGEGVPALGEPA